MATKLSMDILDKISANGNEEQMKRLLEFIERTNKGVNNAFKSSSFRIASFNNFMINWNWFLESI